MQVSALSLAVVSGFGGLLQFYIPEYAARMLIARYQRFSAD